MENKAAVTNSRSHKKGRVDMNYNELPNLIYTDGSPEMKYVQADISDCVIKNHNKNKGVRYDLHIHSASWKGKKFRTKTIMWCCGYRLENGVEDGSMRNYVCWFKDPRIIRAMSKTYKHLKNLGIIKGE